MEFNFKIGFREKCVGVSKKVHIYYYICSYGLNKICYNKVTLN